MTIESLFANAPEVRPGPITGQERPGEVLMNAFPAYVGRQVRTAYQLLRKAILDDHTVFLTVSGAMTPAGLHRSCLVPLVQRGLVDVLTTTGANLYHDAHRVIGHRLREVAPDAGDERLRQAGIVRIYDLGFTEDVLLDTDRLFAKLLLKPAFQHPMTTVEMNRELGRELAALEATLGVDQPCLLSAAWQAGVPVFVGAPQDGSIFLNAVLLKGILGDAFRFQVDPLRDVHTMAALQWHAQAAGPFAIWMLGGGVPKNYTLQGEPTLSQIFGLEARGFDLDVQVCVENVDNGALSPCPAGEGHTWGKVSAECLQTSSVYVHADVTAVVPWLVYALFNDGLSRPGKRMADRIPEAVARLDAALAARKDEILRGLED